MGRLLETYCCTSRCSLTRRAYVKFVLIDVYKKFYFTEKQDILKYHSKEIETLANNNFKEVTLLGQNIDAYGRDLPGTTKEGRKENTLTDLLYFIQI